MKIKIEEYQKATVKYLKEIELFEQKIENLVLKRDEGVKELSELSEKLSKLNTDILMTLDELEIKEIKMEMSSIKQRVEELSHFKNIDVGEIIKTKLTAFVSDDKIKKLEAEARQENDQFHAKIDNMISEHEKQIDELNTIKRSHIFPQGSSAISNIRSRALSSS